MEGAVRMDGLNVYCVLYVFQHNKTVTHRVVPLTWNIQSTQIHKDSRLAVPGAERGWNGEKLLHGCGILLWGTERFWNEAELVVAQHWELY